LGDKANEEADLAASKEMFPAIKDGLQKEGIKAALPDIKGTSPLLPS